MHDLALEGVKFIDLTWMNIGFLFVVGFISSLVSGFIGSGGAFVLTPGMMRPRSPRCGRGGQQHVSQIPQSHGRGVQEVQVSRLRSSLAL